jgi:uncharacterized membrane protein
MATWGTLHFNIQMCNAMMTLIQINQSSAGIITVFIISIEVIAWCILDWTVFRRHLIFVVTPYIALIVGLVAITDFKPMDVIGSIPSILLGLVIVITMVRLTRVFWDASRAGNLYTKSIQSQNAQETPLPDLIPLAVM